MADEATNGTPAGQIERIARVVAQVGFPTVVAGVLLYTLLVEFGPGVRDLRRTMRQQTAVMLAICDALHAEPTCRRSMSHDLHELR